MRSLSTQLRTVKLGTTRSSCTSQSLPGAAGAHSYHFRPSSVPFWQRDSRTTAVRAVCAQKRTLALPALARESLGRRRHGKKMCAKPPGNLTRPLVLPTGHWTFDECSPTRIPTTPKATSAEDDFAGTEPARPPRCRSRSPTWSRCGREARRSPSCPAGARSRWGGRGAPRSASITPLCPATTPFSDRCRWASPTAPPSRSRTSAAPTVRPSRASAAPEGSAPR